MATQPQAKKAKGGNVKKQLAAQQCPPDKNTVEANTIPQLKRWRDRHPRRILLWEKG